MTALGATAIGATTPGPWVLPTLDKAWQFYVLFGWDHDGSGAVVLGTGDDASSAPDDVVCIDHRTGRSYYGTIVIADRMLDAGTGGIVDQIKMQVQGLVHDALKDPEWPGPLAGIDRDVLGAAVVDLMVRSVGPLSVLSHEDRMAKWSALYLGDPEDPKPSGPIPPDPNDDA